MNIKDFSRAFYALRKSTTYTIAVVVTLGITLGALTTAFNLNYQILKKPLPYPNQNKLVLLKGDLIKDGKILFSNMYAYPAAIEVYKNSQPYFSEKALIIFGTNILRNLPESPRVKISYVTPQYFSLLQQPLVLGRFFTDDETLNRFEPHAIISFVAWQRMFKGASNVLGQSIQIEGTQFKIIGVTAKEFIEPQIMGSTWDTEIWLPWDFNQTPKDIRQAWGMLIQNMYILGTIKNELNLSESEKKITAPINTRYQQEVGQYYWAKGNSIDLKLVKLREIILGDSAPGLHLLFVGTCLLLLIAAANLSTLILARGASQTQTMAIHAALGAKKIQLLRLAFSELLLLALAAFFVSIVVGAGCVELIKRFASDLLPRITELQLSAFSVLITFIFALILATIFGLTLYKKLNYRSLNSYLKNGGKGIGVQFSSRLRYTLIIIQTMITSILLTASFQIVSTSFEHILQPVGFNTKNIFLFSVSRPQESLSTNGKLALPSRGEIQSQLDTIQSTIANDPRIQKIAFGGYAPINSENFQSLSFLSEDVDFKQQRQAICSYIDENYLSMLGTSLIAGRYFTREEFITKAPVVVINETFAHQLQPNGRTLGKRYYFLNSADRNTPFEVIGIIRDFSLPNESEVARMFVPDTNSTYPQWLIEFKPNQLMSRTELNHFASVTPNQFRVSDLQSLSSLHSSLIALDKLWASLSVCLVLVVIVLASFGIYGILNYSVQLRRSELGIRMALGANPRKLFWQIYFEYLKPITIGIFISLIATVGAVQTQLFQNTSFAFYWFNWILTNLVILTLAFLVALLALWKIINQPASNALREI